METRNNERKMEFWRRRKFNFSEAFYVNPVGSAGGLALWWSVEVKLEILSFSKNVIHVFIKEGWGDFSGAISFIYGPPLEGDRDGFWNRMRGFRPSGGNWICLGDFNDLAAQSEKLGGRISSSRRFINLQTFLFDCELVDLGFKGPKFTCSNGQLDWRHVKERHDRALCNLAFRRGFQKVQVLHLDKVGSDHCPLLLILEFCETKAPRSFKFEAIWLEHPDILDVVGNAWLPIPSGEYAMPDLLLKSLDACRKALIEWSKVEFPNNRKKIERLLKELTECDTGILSNVQRGRSMQILAEIEDFWHKEEVYWWQRSRVAWLKNGDRNSSFFHTSTIQRRVRNKILKIKNANGDWLDHEELIVVCVNDYFENIFKHSGPRDLSPVLDYVDSLVTSEDNTALCLPATAEEVRVAAFELGGSKAPGPDGYSAYEAFHYLKAKKNGNRCEVAMKVDMSKAYDGLEWDFIEQVLLKFGFSDYWVSFISRCIRSVEYNILLSGRKVVEVHLSRGVRQGNPLSPYLFILAADVLLRMVSFHADRGDLRGIKLARGCPSLTHCFFADDSIFFFQADWDSCHKMKWILDLYCNALGQLANLEKSCLYFTPNTPVALKDEIVRTFGIDSADHPGKYLGLLVVWGKSKDEALAFVRDKLIKKIQAFPMSCFKFPKKTCVALDHAIARFWWDQKKDEGRIHWVTWNKLAKAKREGGLGFCDFSYFNDALLAKQGWRILHEPNELWVRILKGVYFPNGDFLSAKRGARASWAWSSLLEGRDLLAKGLIWSVGDGNAVKAWMDPWIPNAPGFKPLSRPLHAGGLEVKVNEFISNGRWNVELLRCWFSEKECADIINISLSITNRSDKLLWSHNRSGLFTVKSGYSLALKDSTFVIVVKPSSSFVPSSNLWTDIWRINICHKVKHFLWRICWNSIPTKENLFNRKCSPSPACPICKVEVETVEHLLFFCGWTRGVWSGCSFPLKVGRFEARRVDEWCEGVFGKDSSLNVEQMALVACLCWSIWKSICSFIFENKDVAPARVFSSASDLVREFALAKAGKPSPSGPSRAASSSSLSWKLPVAGQLKANVDGAFSSSGAAGLGVLIRDDAGRVVDGCSASCYASSSFMCEALAVRKALLWASDLNIVDLVVESDCKALVDAVNSLAVSPDWHCAAIVDDIRSLRTSLRWVHVSWVPRELNLAADWLAKAAVWGVCRLGWVSSPQPPWPPCLLRILVLLGMGLVNVVLLLLSGVFVLVFVLFFFFQ
ncbi:reverse transcriptase [Senna tora]|uniref:Reverse transcriptase n=1 Tax=Senna tora TaxID=362788 RepID=A0A835CGP1_9FABA|nr:reverse transcriptase [Senna tora]